MTHPDGGIYSKFTLQASFPERCNLKAYGLTWDSGHMPYIKLCAAKSFDTDFICLS